MHGMRTYTPWILIGCGVVALACGSPAAPLKTGQNETGGTGGDDETGGTGGTGGRGTGGTGGTAGKAGNGGTGGTAGTSGIGTMAGSGGSGGSAATPDSGATAEPDAGAPVTMADAAPPVNAGPVPFGCTNCKPIFDGKTLEGWETRTPTNWLAKDGVLASQGTTAPIWTKADYGDYRIFFKVRQVMGNHKPDVIFFGKRPGPTGGQSGALGGAQFQPPNGGSWDYGAGGTFNRPENPMWSDRKWHHCEVLVKEAGSFRAACCPMEPEAPCKLVLTWRGTGRKHPFAIQMHNNGLFDEYKDIFVEENPTVDELLCLKK